MEEPNEMAGTNWPKLIGSTDSGKRRTYEMANKKNKNIKFRIVLDTRYKEYECTITVIQPPTDN
jgi:hypothetical protein